MGLVQELVKKHRLISNQVDDAEVAIILNELRRVLTANLQADVVEFGCYGGTTSLMIRRLMDALDAEGEFWVYDSFAGLPEKGTEDQSTIGEDFKQGELRVSKRDLLQNFRKAGLSPPDRVIKAWFSDITASELPSSIDFAFLDGDFYESILVPLKLIGPNLSARASIIVDDYTNQALPGAKRAVDHWLQTDPSGQTYRLDRIQSSLAVLKPATS